MYGREETLFSTRYKCLKLVKNEEDDFTTYAGQINKHCEQFELSKLTVPQFKCLLFVRGLQSSRDSDIRTRLLAKIDAEKDAIVTLDAMLEECQRILNIKHDTALIQSGTIASSSVRAINDGKSKKCHSSTGTSKKTPKTPCWLCGGLHCSFKQHKCLKCSKIGLKD